MTLRFPIEIVFRRGAVFRQGLFDNLDDPAYRDDTKPKYFVMLSRSPLDDPILYILTTSVPKYATLPDVVTLPAGRYGFLPAVTYIVVATAEQQYAERDRFMALYESGEVECLGHLLEPDTKRIEDAIRACGVVSRTFKQMLGLI